MSTPPPESGRRVRRPWLQSERTLPRVIARPVQEFMHQEAAGGVVLAAASIVALIWANVDPSAYADLWSTEIVVSVGDFTQTEELQKVVNDGLMAVFFLVIGLEVKREIAVGELSSRSAAMLPLFAALGGMVLPAAIFLAITAGGTGSEGWGIPIATDVAFALAALASLGRRAPTSLVAFLLGVAVIDDILAIGVIAIFYSDAISLGWLIAAIVVLASMYVLVRIHVRYIGVYVALAVLAWFFTFESGVHATIAGVAIGLLTPVRPFQPPGAVSIEAVRIAHETEDHPDDPDEYAADWRRLAWLSKEAISPLTRVEHGLHQWASFLVLPLFALANAGIVLSADAIEAASENGVALAIAVGLVAGKTLGLSLGALGAVRLGVARLPHGVGWTEIVGVAALAGIGFTVSLFIAGLAFDDPVLRNGARMGILAGSLVAAALGLGLLLLAARRRAARASLGD